MLGPVLKKKGENRLCYSTSTAFRAMCFSSGIIILYILLIGAEKPFNFKENLIALTLSLICLISALFLERIVFDKESNQFEKHLGLLFIYSRLARPLDSLECISLKEFNGNSSGVNEIKPSILSRNYASITIVTANKEIFKIDMAKNSETKKFLKTAEEISKFCDIPLVKNNLLRKNE